MLIAARIRLRQESGEKRRQQSANTNIFLFFSGYNASSLLQTQISGSSRDVARQSRVRKAQSNLRLLRGVQTKALGTHLEAISSKRRRFQVKTFFVD